ncbi:MAG: hypothetical protein O3B83_04265 [Bacteroidetes bacterium]|nr:hypothetical protein [Bacteroidota bacterium]
MKPFRPLVIGVSLYLLFYALTPLFGLELKFVYPLFVIGNLLVIYMVYAALKYGVAPKEKFSEGYWYGDIKGPIQGADEVESASE